MSMFDLLSALIGHSRSVIAIAQGKDCAEYITSGGDVRDAECVLAFKMAVTTHPECRTVEELEPFMAVKPDNVFWWCVRTAQRMAVDKGIAGLCL